MVEIKGTLLRFSLQEFFFTSNVNPRNWYPDINEQQLAGL